MKRSRRADAAAGPADERMARYLDGQHHPQHAHLPRVAYVAEAGGRVVGYIAGHLTSRFDCDGELQYLYVAPDYRRRGVASALLRALAFWFRDVNVRRVCVDVDEDDEPARAFYAHHGAVRLRPHWMVWEDIQGCIDRVPAGPTPSIVRLPPHSAQPDRGSTGRIARIAGDPVRAATHGPARS